MVSAMQSLRQTLAGGFLERIEKELGREAAVRLLWPCIVGAGLANHTQFKAIRGNTLLVSVPDRSWLDQLDSMNTTVLDAVNRMGIGKAFDAVQFVEDAKLFPPRAATQQTAAKPPEAGNDLFESEAGTIADESLRRAFLASARKYCNARPNRMAGTDPSDRDGGDSGSSKAKI